MLVLSRKPDEQIRIGDNITVTIIKTSGKTVRLGIEAPRDVRVLRGELTPRPEGSDAGTSKGSTRIEVTATTTGSESSPVASEDESCHMAAGNRGPQTIRMPKSRCVAEFHTGTHDSSEEPFLRRGFRKPDRNAGRRTAMRDRVRRACQAKTLS